LIYFEENKLLPKLWAKRMGIWNNGFWTGGTMDCWKNLTRWSVGMMEKWRFAIWKKILSERRLAFADPTKLDGWNVGLMEECWKIGAME
jgi:hypothetical protein